MYFTLLILGVALWWGAHLFKRVAPDARSALGDRGKGLVAVLLLVSVVLMVVGYRGAEVLVVWSPPAFLTHLNNLLMVLAIYLFVADGVKARAAVAMPNPQLTGFKTWAVAHLLVNGDLASVVLFGGLLAWAVVSVIVLKRAGVRPAKRAWGGVKAEAIAVVGTVVVFGAVAWVHNWLGYWPYG
ncbi:MAG: NnrU family protein [Gemmobacter sp.]|jgi:uncharacterized membrane protein|nr:NnrU family protein [Gemmobacter sp.]